MAELLYRIGRFAARRRGTVVLVWLAILAATVGAYVIAGGAPAGEMTIPGTPTAQVTDRLQAAFPEAAGGTGTIVFSTEDASPISDAQQEAIADRIAQASKVGGVESVLDPFTAQAEREDQAAEIAAGQAKLAKSRAQITGGQVQIDRAKAKLTAGQVKLDAAKKKLVDGQAQLDAAKAKLPAAQAKIDAGRVELATGQAQARRRKKKLAAGQQQLDAAKKKLSDGQAQLDAGKAQLVAQQAQLDAAIAQAKQDGTYDQMADQFAASQAQIDAGMAQITAEQAELDAGRATIAAKQQQIDAGKATIAKNQAKIDAGKAKLAAGQAQLDAGRATIAANQAKITAGRATIKEKQAQIRGGRTTIRDKQAELDKAPAKLAAATKKLEAGATLLDLASGIRLVSEDGSAAIAMVSFTEPQMAVTQATKDALIAAFEDTPVDGVSAGFSPTIASEVPSVVGPKELAGLVIAAIVLFALLGTLVAAGLPILTALIGVGIATLGALSLSSVLDMTSVTPILGIMLGLAVGIDYALFIVNRHRRQLSEGYSVEESIALANGTSGNAVVFAGMTVIIALVALNVTGIPFLGLMGSIGAASVAIAVLIAVTLTPALLSYAGVHVLRRGEKARIASGVHAAPAPAEPLPTWRALAQVVVGIAVLVMLAVPAASMRLGLPDGSSEATGSAQYRAYALVAEKFGEGQNGTLLVIADLPKGTSDERVARPPGRGREGDLGARRRVGGRAGPDVGRSHHRRLPGRAEGGADERVHRAARGRHPRRLATAWRHHARRRGPDERRDRHLAEARGRAAGLPGGRDGAVAADHDHRLPLAPRPARRHRRLRSLAVRDARRHGRHLPERLARRDLRGLEPRADPELPAHPARGHPLRPGDGLPPVPGLGDARGVCARGAVPDGGRPRLQGRAGRGGRGRDHHGLGVRRVHVRGQRDDPADRLRPRVRRPRGRVRGAHGDPAGPDAPAGRPRLVAARLARPPDPERRCGGRRPRAQAPACGQ